jgi:hypothetical protein
LTCDVLHFHRCAPLCPHDRRCRFAEVDALRRAAATRIAWPVLMLKAYALVARDVPPLRQAWLAGLIPNIYEHPHSVGMLAIERVHRGERWLFWGRFPTPETTPLTTLQQNLERYQTQPVEQAFRRQLQLSGVPNPFRRLLWWWNLNVSGAARAKRAGTYFLTTLAGRGAEIQNPPSFHTGNLTYGPIDESGFARVTLSYDHRLMDGAVVAEALARLEATLHGTIAAELRSLSPAATHRHRGEAA